MMPIRAPRLLPRVLHCRARGALPAACLLLAGAAPAVADTIHAARYADPTDRYAHGILGDAIEWGTLELTLSDGSVRAFALPRDHVFEDVAPRLADLDGDGAPEVTYVDRPHLAKTLRIWRYQNATLVDVAAFEGVTNHRIGEVDIAGGIRTCTGMPEMIVATADWSHLLAVKWDGGGFIWSYLGEDTTRPMFARALECAE